MRRKDTRNGFTLGESSPAMLSTLFSRLGKKERKKRLNSNYDDSQWRHSRSIRQLRKKFFLSSSSPSSLSPFLPFLFSLFWYVPGLNAFNARNAGHLPHESREQRRTHQNFHGIPHWRLCRHWRHSDRRCGD